MTFASASQFHVYTYCGVKARLAYCLNSVLNVKALIGAFNQEKALVGAFSVIVQFHWLIVYSTKHYTKLRALEKSVCSVPSKKCVLLWSSGESDPTQYIWTLVVASLLHLPQKPGAKQIFSRPVKLLDIKECWDELWVK